MTMFADLILSTHGLALGLPVLGALGCAFLWRKAKHPDD